MLTNRCYEGLRENTYMLINVKTLNNVKFKMKVKLLSIFRIEYEKKSIIIER